MARRGAADRLEAACDQFGARLGSATWNRHHSLGTSRFSISSADKGKNRSRRQTESRPRSPETEFHEELEHPARFRSGPIGSTSA